MKVPRLDRNQINLHFSKQYVTCIMRTWNKGSPTLNHNFQLIRKTRDNANVSENEHRTILSQYTIQFISIEQCPTENTHVHRENTWTLSTLESTVPRKAQCATRYGKRKSRMDVLQLINRFHCCRKNNGNSMRRVRASTHVNVPRQHNISMALLIPRIRTCLQ